MMQIRRWTDREAPEVTGKSYTAKRLPTHRGPAGWSAILGPQSAARVLEHDITADFAIIGGGFAGLSAARRLSQLNPTAKIVVLEAGRLAEGAAGRNSGFMIDLPHDLASDNYAGPDGAEGDRKLIALNRWAIAFAQDAAEEYQIARAYVDPAGKVNGAAGAEGHAHNQSYAAHLASLGEPSEALDAQAMRELTGSPYYVSGLYTPGTCVLHPAGYIRSLAAGLAPKVDIFETSPVQAFRQVGSDYQITTPKGQVNTGKIILANNGHMESFGFAKRHLMHVFLFATMTPDLDARALKMLGGTNRWGVTPADPMGTTMRRIDTAQGGNRIITRTCAVFRPGMKSRKGDLKRAREVMREKFDARFPQLAGLAMEYAWAGHLCLSRNAVSIMGEVADNVYAACCQNGLGTARGTMTGMGAAELASGVDSDITRHFAVEAAPVKLPPEPFASVGANVYLRWKEHRAGAE